MAHDGQNKLIIKRLACCFFCIKNTTNWAAASYIHPDWIDDKRYAFFMDKKYVTCSECQKRPESELVDIIVSHAGREVALKEGRNSVKKFVRHDVLDADLKRAAQDDLKRRAERKRKRAERKRKKNS